MQYFILKFLENIRTPLLDLLANIFSAVTEVEILVPIMVVVYLCINKKLGYIIAISFSLVLTLGNTIKTILKIPRPFMKHEDLSPLRVGTATGYSFPSGHSASASVFYPLLRMVFKNKVIRMLFIILPLLIGLSRNYLGVHWPVDVIVGLSLGYLFSIVLYPLFDNLYEDEDKLTRFFIIAIIIGLIMTVIYGLKYLRTLDRIAYRDSLTCAAVLFSVNLGLLIEKKKINFKHGGSMLKRSLNVLLCILGMLALSAIHAEGRGDVFVVIFKNSGIMLWVTCIYPYIAVKLGLLTHEER